MGLIDRPRSTARHGAPRPSRRIALKATVLVLGLWGSHASGAAPADAAPPDLTPAWSGFASFDGTYRRIDGPLNAGNVARVPARALEAALVLDYKQGPFTARARVSHWQAQVPGSVAPDPQVQRLDFPLLQWRRPLDDRWSLTAGRINLRLDDGQSFHPLDFFEDRPRSLDFEDRLGRDRGFPMLMLERIEAQGSVRLVLSDDSLTDSANRYGETEFHRGLQQAVASVRRSLGPLTLGSAWRRAWPGSSGQGGSFSWVPGPQMLLYGAVFSERGNPYPLHPNAYLGRGLHLDGRDVYGTPSPVQPWAAGERRRYHRWLLGSNWAFESGDTLNVEAWRDGRGMNGGQFLTWQRVSGFHEALASESARRGNLAYDQEALRSASGTHLYVRYATTLAGGRTLSVSHLLSQDGSGSLSVEVEGRMGPRHDWRLLAWQRHGGRHSRYGATADPRGASLQWRRFF